MKNLLYILLAISFTSCIATKSARNINKAENRIIKYNEGINNQIREYPSLIDNAFTHIDKELIPIPIIKDTFNIEIVTESEDKEKDKLIEEYITASSIMETNLEDLDKIVIDNKQLKNKINGLTNTIRSQKSTLDALFIKYREVSKYNTKSGTIEKDNFLVKYRYINGKLQLDIQTKDRDIEVSKTVTTNNIKIRKNFWQDKWFYVFLVAMLVALYFMGTTIIRGLKEAVDSLIRLIKRLIFKI